MFSLCKNTLLTPFLQILMWGRNEDSLIMRVLGLLFLASQPSPRRPLVFVELSPPLNASLLILSTSTKCLLRSQLPCTSLCYMTWDVS